MMKTNISTNHSSPSSNPSPLDMETPKTLQASSHALPCLINVVPIKLSIQSTQASEQITSLKRRNDTTTKNARDFNLKLKNYIGIDNLTSKTQ